MTRAESHAAGSGPWTDPDRLGLEAFLHTPNLVIVVDEQRRVGTISPSGVALLGAELDEVVGRPISVLFPDGRVEEGLAALEQLASGETAELEVAFRCFRTHHLDDPAEVPVGLAAAPLWLDGEPRGLILSGRDVEERKRLEHDVRELATSFQALADATEVGFYRFVFDPDFRVDHTNLAFADALGYSPASLQEDPTPLIDGLTPETRQRFIDNRFGRGSPQWPIEFDWERPDGEVVVLSVEEVPIRDPNGRVTAVLGVGRDVTQERRREASIVRALQHERQAAEGLRQVDQLRRLFLQAVSHELRTPLTTVMGFASTLALHADELPVDRVAELSGRMVVQARRIERLLDDLLDVERLSRGVLDLEVARADLASIVTEVLREVADDRVTSHLTPVEVPVDRGKFARVVANLLTNARRHAGPDALVTVAVGPREDGARLVVEDDGPGVPDELKGRVFEPFEQGPRSRALPSPGTGIGLTLVAEFVGLHGGTVHIEDAADGGARFVVDLPGAVAG